MGGGRACAHVSDPIAAWSNLAFPETPPVRKTEGRDQTSEIRDQRTEIRRQRSEASIFEIIPIPEPGTWAVGRLALGGSRSGLALLKRSQFRGTAILAVGPAGILPADKCAKVTGKMPIFPTARMVVPRRLARFSTK